MITASQVKDLREKTGAGMMDCKKVLTETDGDMEKAIELLRERGIAKAAKKSGRIAAEGIVTVYISEDNKIYGYNLVKYYIKDLYTYKYKYDYVGDYIKQQKYEIKFTLK